MSPQIREPSLQHFQKALGLIQNGLLLQDKSGCPLYINQALCHIFGAAEEDILNEGLTRLFPADSIKTIKDKILPETLRFGVGKAELDGINQEGERFPLSISTMTVEDDEDDTVGFVSVCKDLSEEREFQRRKLHSEKLAAVGEMLAGVAHELNNPLTSVVGFSELLLRKRVSPEIKRQLRRISSEAIRTSKIVQNLLSVVRSHKPERILVGVNGVIQNVLELKSRQLHFDNIRLVRRLSDDQTLPKVVGDYQQLLEVFLNLINNAHQAMSADRGKGTLTITTTSNDGAVIIRISDTGPGIEKKIQSKLFQPFFTTKPDGSGLGLNISQKIIREHGGNVTFENGRDRGTSFIICLPVASDAFEPFSAPEIPKPRSSRSLKIMVLDDEEVILDLQYHLLKQLGHEPHLFSSASEALPVLNEQHFDLILADIKMPRINGFKFYKHLERQHPQMTQRLIFITGDSLNQKNNHFFSEHQIHVLYKPFVLKQLEAIIENTLEKQSDPNSESAHETKGIPQ
ncbi:MAG: response regulator [Nitrospirae bacterium]|nr:response regulator [Candidatus Manganitrophaceae bacterium]